MKFNIGDMVKIINIKDRDLEGYLEKEGKIIKSCEGIEIPFYALDIDCGFIAFDEDELELIKKDDNTKLRIKKMRENAKLPEFKGGNWMDTYISEIGFVNCLSGEFNFDNIVYPVDTKLYTQAKKSGCMSVTFNGGGRKYSIDDRLTYKKGDIIILKLGFALELPKGKELHLLPRSGTFRKYGLILTNSMGIGDDTYIGDNDEYMAMMYATRNGEVSVEDRLIQIKIEDVMPRYKFIEVEHFGNEDRGGYGSSGR